jgi:hypothetical protein
MDTAVLSPVPIFFFRIAGFVPIGAPRPFGGDNPRLVSHDAGVGEESSRSQQSGLFSRFTVGLSVLCNDGDVAHQGVAW